MAKHSPSADKLTNTFQKLLLAHQGGKATVQSIQDLASKHATHPAASYALGCLALAARQPEQAEKHFRLALQRGYARPFEVVFNLISLSAMLGKAADLRQYWDQVRRLPQALRALECAYTAAEERQHESVQGLLLDLWAADWPNAPEVKVKQAHLALQQGREDEARRILQDMDASHCTVEQGAALAMAMFKAQMPSFVDVLDIVEAKIKYTKEAEVQSLVNAAGECKQYARQVRVLKQLLLAQPKQKFKQLYLLLGSAQKACLWDEVRHYVPQLVQGLHKGQTPAIGIWQGFTLPGVVEADLLVLAKEYVRRVATGEALPQADFCPRLAVPRSQRKLRIGYLSADFRSHPVTQVCVGVLEQHDKSRFETIAYDSAPKDSRDGPWRDRILATFDQVVDVLPLNTTALVQRIRQDGIDVLVDLQGETAHTRFLALQHRLAPVQVGWLGFAGGCGGLNDYILADATVIPATSFAHYAEKVVWLPHCYHPTEARRLPLEAPPRAVENLPENAFVFVCFNGAHKVTEEVFGIWCAIVRRVEGSVLWMPDCPADVRQRLCAAAQGHGLAPERCIFAPRRQAQTQHQARLQLADLALDTLPYNSHTTCIDAIWSGVPLLTLPGQTFAGRVAASMLRAVGLDELIMTSWPQYIEKAVALAGDKAELARLRRHCLAQRQGSPLFDEARFARNLEAAFDAMYDRFERGLPPDHIAVQEGEASQRTTRPTDATGGPAASAAQSVPFLLEKAVHWLQQDEHAKASALFSQVLGLEGNNAEALHGMGLIYGMRGQYDISLQLLEKSVALEPDSQWFKVNLERMRTKSEENFVQLAAEMMDKGMALHQEGKLDEARTCYDRILEANAYHAAALHFSGLTLVQQGDFQQGLERMLRALKIQPHNTVFQENYTKAKAGAEARGISIIGG